MQAEISNPSFSLTPPDMVESNAGDIVSLLAGGSRVVLHGFGEKSASLGSWSHPATPFIPARDFDRAAPEMTLARARWRRLTWWFFGVGMLIGGFAAGFAASTSLVEWSVAPIRTGWAITKVQDKGVVLRIGEGNTVVPVGGRLPNGDAVVSVFPATSVVVLESSILKLREATAAVKPEETK